MSTERPIAVLGGRAMDLTREQLKLLSKIAQWMKQSPWDECDYVVWGGCDGAPEGLVRALLQGEGADPKSVRMLSPWASIYEHKEKKDPIIDGVGLKNMSFLFAGVYYNPLDRFEHHAETLVEGADVAIVLGGGSGTVTELSKLDPQVPIIYFVGFEKETTADVVDYLKTLSRERRVWFLDMRQ